MIANKPIKTKDNLNKWQLDKSFGIIMGVCLAIHCVAGFIFSFDTENIRSFYGASYNSTELHNQMGLGLLLSLICILAGKISMRVRNFFSPELLIYEKNQPINSLAFGTALTVICLITSYYIYERGYDLIIRSTYQQIGVVGEKISPLYRLSKGCTEIAVIFVGFLAGAASSRAKSFLCWVILIILICIYYADGGRAVALAPFFALIGYKYSCRKKYKNIYREIGVWLACFAWFVLLWELCYYNRRLHEHGLIPYFLELGYKEIWESALEFDNIRDYFVVPFIIQIASEEELMGFAPAVAMLINPLGGEASGWDEVANQFRISIAVPTAGLAEFTQMNTYEKFYYGIWVMVMILIIDYTGHFVKKDSLVNGLMKSMLWVMGYGWSALFLSYPLRGSSRIFYYAAALSFACFLIYVFERKKSNLIFSEKIDK